MDFFFKPQGVAVIGATPNPFKGGNAILKNLIAGFRGGIYPINPRYEEIEGLPCFPTVEEAPDPVDLAIVFVPGPQVPDAVGACAQRRIPGVIIESGGFAETGDDGGRRQASLVAMARQTGIRLWGPNCMGLVDVVNGHVFSFLDPRAFPSLIPGRVSLVVQSGMLSAGFLVDIMTHGVMGISKVCSVGNKIDVDECDLLPWLLEDPDTDVIGLYLESLLNGRRFLDICRNAAKPIVVLKGGRSPKGAQAAMSHTASLAGDNRIIQGAFAQAGIVEASDFKELTDLCRTLSLFPAHRKEHPGRIAVLTYSGGAGIVSADFIAAHGLETAELSESTKEEIGRLFPEWMPVNNPVDLWPAMERHAAAEVDVINQSLAATCADPQVDAVFIHAFVGSFRIRLDLEEVARQSRETGKPVFIWLLGRRDDAFQFQNEARELGIPVFSELGRAVACMAAALNKR
ncbi:MAG: CoA-binding protein [Pseudomonadota bacterium]|nr:CoA-binding protein [Pseudomonadota bacterium]